jgi:hypothetical protein
MPLSLLSDDLPEDGPPTSGPGRDAAWLELIQAGDVGAFEALFHDHYPGLCVFAARLVASDAIAEELVQDVLLRVWQQREPESHPRREVISGNTRSNVAGRG